MGTDGLCERKNRKAMRGRWNKRKSKLLRGYRREGDMLDV